MWARCVNLWRNLYLDKILLCWRNPLFFPHSVQYFVIVWLLLMSRIRSTALLCIVIWFGYITKHYVQDSPVRTQCGFCYCVTKINYCTLLHLEWMSYCLKLGIVKSASYYYSVLLCIITGYFHLKCDILVFVIKGHFFWCTICIVRRL